MRNKKSKMCKILTQKKGAAIVEFALVLPLLVMLLFGIIEMGRAFYTWSVMSEATREGARVGIVEIDDTEAATVAETATSDFLNQMSMTGVAVNADITQIGGVDMVRVQATFDFQPFGLQGIIPAFTINARSIMRQEG